jgi:hypothetical protein
MGLNTTVIVVKPLGEKRFNVVEILNGLRKSVVIEQEDVDLEIALRNLMDKSSGGVIAAADFKEMAILVDDGHYIDLKDIPPFTSAYPAEVLRVEHSDTVEAGEFSFWVKGELIRKVSFGFEDWIIELKEAGITDEEILKGQENVDIGAALEFEKDSTSPMDVLARYALDYFDFYDLRWSTYQVAI